jgi:hypothetical protein
MKPDCFGDETQYSREHRTECRISCLYRSECAKEISDLRNGSFGPKINTQTYIPSTRTPYQSPFQSQFQRPVGATTSTVNPPVQQQQQINTIQPPVVTAPPPTQSPVPSGQPINKPAVPSGPVGFLVKSDTPAEVLLKRMLAGALSAVGYEAHKFFAANPFNAGVAVYYCGACNSPINPQSTYCGACHARIR